MDCKKALAENNNDIDTSIEWLRKKGLSGADKKASRVAAEGVVTSYIHAGSRIGVLLEVNCETDFVAKSDGFVALVNQIAMQLAASPTVQYVAKEDIPAEVFEREKQIEMGREDLKSKPEAIRWVGEVGEAGGGARKRVRNGHLHALPQVCGMVTCMRCHIRGACRTGACMIA